MPATHITPTVGMAATETRCGHKSAFTVHEVAGDGQSCLLRQDLALRTDHNGMSMDQTYVFSRNPTGFLITAVLGPHGWVTVEGNEVTLGERVQLHNLNQGG